MSRLNSWWELFPLALLLLCARVSGAEGGGGVASEGTVILAVGAAGTAEYGQMFGQWTDRWRVAAEKGGYGFKVIGGVEAGSESADGTDLSQLERALASERESGKGPLWLVFIGHGTFDGREARFNLRGPDLVATNLASWVRGLTRPLVVIQCASASGAFMPVLAGPGRVVVTSCQSGFEENFSRFAGFYADALAEPKADLDRDGQTSVLECFLYASRLVAQFYETDGRLATEHALIDDNGDGLGTPADWFRGLHVVKKPEAGKSVDGILAHQQHLVASSRQREMPLELRSLRDRLETELSQLRGRKAELPEDRYYTEVERIVRELGKLYLGQGWLKAEKDGATVVGEK